MEEVQNSIIMTGSNSHDPIKEFVCVDIGDSFLVLLFKKTLYVAKALLLQFESQVSFNLPCFGYHLVIQNSVQNIDLKKKDLCSFELVDLERKCTKNIAYNRTLCVFDFHHGAKQETATTISSWHHKV